MGSEIFLQRRQTGHQSWHADLKHSYINHELRQIILRLVRIPFTEIYSTSVSRIGVSRDHNSQEALDQYQKPSGNKSQIPTEVSHQSLPLLPSSNWDLWLRFWEAFTRSPTSESGVSPMSAILSAAVSSQSWQEGPLGLQACSEGQGAGRCCLQKVQSHEVGSS